MHIESYKNQNEKPMTNLNELKVHLKKSVSKNLINTINYLKEIISVEDNLYDELILFSSRNYRK